MRTSQKTPRPKYLDLRHIKLPVTGVISIAHRISGVFLVASIPVWLYLLELSLSGSEGFQQAVALNDGFLFSLLSIVCFWALVHHFFAGIRFLLLDVEIGGEKQAALKTAKWVFVIEVIVMLPIIGWLL
ncbi:MAG TPA: succinate dehydrogenase, cytochrome b556 subunit [Gammaproteobacteria bacterium]|nr:succinate dehydrogenase, cytochrome b556 subunit [Gammaproteobacteria bacterium]